MDFLVSSSAPYFALSLAGAMVAAFGLTRLERSRWAAFGVRVLPNHSEMSGRLLIGQIAGIPLAFILILIALISGSAAGYRNLLFMLAIGVYLRRTLGTSAVSATSTGPTLPDLMRMRSSGN